jgi:16S rRNA (guanine527-N7)-methyltransferase
VTDAESELLGRVPVKGVMALRELVDLIATDEHAPTTVRDPQEAWRTHVLDSLTGLEVPQLREAKRIADVGAGAGFPGMALAAALPEAHVELIEATGRKCDFMERALEHTAIHNARVVCARAEEWGASRPPDGGRGDADVVTARAVGRLSTLAELASPLLREGGALVAWKGRRDPDEEAEAARAAERLAMELEGVLATPEAAGFEHRHLYLYVKSGPTPHGLPRRAGMAKKRPLGSESAT